MTVAMQNHPVPAATYSCCLKLVTFQWQPDAIGRMKKRNHWHDCCCTLSYSWLACLLLLSSTFQKVWGCNPAFPKHLLMHLMHPTFIRQMSSVCGMLEPHNELSLKCWWERQPSTLLKIQQLPLPLIPPGNLHGRQAGCRLPATRHVNTDMLLPVRVTVKDVVALTCITVFGHCNKIALFAVSTTAALQ